MKYLIPLLLISTSAVAQENPKCADASKIYNLLYKDYGEKPFIQFKGTNGSDFIMFVNPKTDTYTVVQVIGDMMCAVSAGGEFKPADTKALEEKYKDKGPPT